MGSGDGQTAVPLHQPAEHFGIAQDRNAEFCGPTKFGIVGRNGAAVDHALDIRAHLFRRMSGKATDSCLRQGIVAADRQVRAAQPPTFVEQDPRQGPHAGTPDANQVGPPRSASFKDGSSSFRVHASLLDWSIYHIQEKCGFGPRDCHECCRTSILRKAVMNVMSISKLVVPFDAVCPPFPTPSNLSLPGALSRPFLGGANEERAVRVWPGTPVTPSRHGRIAIFSLWSDGLDG